MVANEPDGFSSLSPLAVSIVAQAPVIARPSSGDQPLSGIERYSDMINFCCPPGIPITARKALVHDEWFVRDSTLIVPLDGSAHAQFQGQNQPL
jgi:hypothetical protein